MNQWHFSPECIKASYFAALKSGIDIFEMGYRNFPSKKGLGPFGYCTDEYLNELIQPSENCKIAIMMDVGKTDTSLVQERDPAITPVGVIRVAAYPYEYQKAFSLIRDFKAKGYEVFLQLMAFSKITDEQFQQLVYWDEKDLINAIYFADSFGNFMPYDIPIHFEKVRSLGFDTIGYHAHNNLQLAFANALKAIEVGVKYIDASIFGMGRGAGNLPMEVLVGYLEKQGRSKYNTMAILDVIERFYLDLHKELRWGYRMDTLLSGLKNIHPYYVKELVTKRNYTMEEIWNILDLVLEKCPISFSSDSMNEVLMDRFYTPVSEEKAEQVLEELSNQFKIIEAPDSVEITEKPPQFPDRKFVILCNGPSILKYQEEIQEFIDREKCVTIGVNYLKEAFNPNFHMFVSRKRFQKYNETVSPESILLVPSFFGKDFVEEHYSGQVQFFNIESVDDYARDPVQDNTQYIVNLNVGVSAILMAYQMGAAEILTVGMDGYVDELNKKMVYFYNENDVPDDKDVASIRYEKLMQELERVNLFLQREGRLFSIITPTSHKKYHRNLLGLE